MNLQELIEQLEELKLTLEQDLDEDPEIEVRIASQPNYPLQSSLRCLTLDLPQGVLWLAEGGGTDSGYAPHHAWDGDIIWDEDHE